MKSTFPLLSFLLLLVFNLPATAAVFERDWKTPGDGLLTYDDVNQREWLDLSESQMLLFPGIHNSQRLPLALLELEPGGLFDGFIFAKTDDVITFAQSAGIDTSIRDYEMNQAATLNVMGLLSTTFTSLNGSGSSTGFTDSFSVNTNPPERIAATFKVKRPMDPPSKAGLFFSIANDLTRRETNGLLLYRQTVPEPMTIVLSALSLIGLLLHGRFLCRPKVSQLPGDIEH